MEKVDPDFDDLDNEIDELCDTLEMSVMIEKRRLCDINETKDRVLNLISEDTNDSLREAANESRDVAVRIGGNWL